MKYQRKCTISDNIYTNRAIIKFGTYFYRNPCYYTIVIISLIHDAIYRNGFQNMIGLYKGKHQVLVVVYLFNWIDRLDDFSLNCNRIRLPRLLHCHFLNGVYQSLYLQQQLKYLQGFFIRPLDVR